MTTTVNIAANQFTAAGPIPLAGRSVTFKPIPIDIDSISDTILSEDAWEVPISPSGLAQTLIPDSKSGYGVKIMSSIEGWRIIIVANYPVGTISLPDLVNNYSVNPETLEPIPAPDAWWTALNNLVNNSVALANQYTDEQIVDAKAYTDDQIAALDVPGVLTAANAYTDSAVADATTELQAYTDNAVTSSAGYVNALAYGAVGDGVTDNAAAFRDAVAAAIANGTKAVYVPDGAFIVTPTLNSIVIPLTVGVRFFGAGIGRTIIKIANAPSPASPVNWKAFIGSNTFSTIDLTGLEVSDFTFDYNTANNPVTDVSSLGSGNRAMVMAPQGKGITVKNLEAINGDGKWVVQLGGTYAAAIIGGYRCDDATVDITVSNFGINSAYHDSSAVYIIGDRARVRGRYVAASTAPGAIAAVELHGNLYDLSVIVDGWVSIANLTGLDATTSHGGVAHDCVGRNLMNGFVIWSGNSIGASGFGIDGLTITGNDIELNPDLWSGTGKASPPGNFGHAGITLNDMGATYNLPMRNIKIRNNNIRYVATTDTSPKSLDSGICLVRAAVMSGTPAHDQNIDISGNTIDSPLGAGIYVSLNNQLDGFTVNGAYVRNPAQNGLGSMASTFAAGAVVAGKMFVCALSDVSVIDDRATLVVTSAVNLGGTSNADPATGRHSVIDPTLAIPLNAGGPPLVIGPSSTGGVYVRFGTYGWVAPTGRIAYGSEITDYANGRVYRQVTSPVGSNWQIVTDGLSPLLGAASVVAATPAGLPYVSTLTTSGAPSAAPTVRSGLTPIVIDSAGKIWVYVGGSWKGVATA